MVLIGAKFTVKTLQKQKIMLRPYYTPSSPAKGHPLS